MNYEEQTDILIIEALNYGILVERFPMDYFSNIAPYENNYT